MWLGTAIVYLLLLSSMTSLTVVQERNKGHRTRGLLLQSGNV